MPLLAITFALLTQSTIRVTPTDLVAAKEPQIAIDKDSHVYVAFGMGDSVFVAISVDEGKTYGAPILVGSPGKLSLGMRRGPRIAAHDGVITISAIYGAQGKGRDGDLVAFHSRDRGRTWSSPVRINDIVSSAREGLHAMAVSPSGELACAWLDMRDKGTKLFVAKSRNGGETWTEDAIAYQSPSGTICECCHPSLAYGGTDVLHILFRNSLDGNRDMYLMRTPDSVVSGGAVKLGTASWQLQACPMDGGMLATGTAGLQTVWRREGAIYTSTGSAQETFVAEGRNPWIAPMRKGHLLTWQNGKSVMLQIPGQAARTVAEEGGSPVAASPLTERFSIVAWANRGIESLRIAP